MTDSESSDLDCSDDEVRSVPYKRHRRAAHPNPTVMKEGDTSSNEGWSQTSQTNWISFQKQFDDVSRTRPMILLYFDQGEEKLKSSSHFREDPKLKKMVDFFRYLLTGEIRPQEGMNHIEMEEVLQMLDVDPIKMKVEELRDLYKKLCNVIFKRTKSKNFWTDTNKPEGWPLEHFQGPDNAGKGKNGHRLKQGELREVIVWFQERYGPNGLHWKQQSKSASCVSGDTKIPSLPMSLLSVESGLGSSVLGSSVFSPPGSTYTPGPKSVKTPGPPSTPLNKTPRLSDVKSPKGLQSVPRVSSKPHTPLPKTPKAVVTTEMLKGSSVKIVPSGDNDANPTAITPKKIKKEPCLEGCGHGTISAAPAVLPNISETEIKMSNQMVNSNTVSLQMDRSHAVLPPVDMSGTTMPSSDSGMYEVAQNVHVAGAQHQGSLPTTTLPTTQSQSTAISLTLCHPCSIPTPTSTSNTALTVNIPHHSNSPEPTVTTALTSHHGNAPQMNYYNEMLPVKKETMVTPACVMPQDQTVNSHGNKYALSQTTSLHNTDSADNVLLNMCMLNSAFPYFELKDFENIFDNCEDGQTAVRSVSPEISPALGNHHYSDELLSNTTAQQNMDWSDHADAVSVISDDSNYMGSYENQNRQHHFPLLNAEHDPLLSNNRYHFSNEISYSNSSLQTNLNAHSNTPPTIMYRSPGKKGGKQQKRLQQAAHKRIQNNTNSGSCGKRMRKSRGKHLI